MHKYCTHKINPNLACKLKSHGLSHFADIHGDVGKQLDMFNDMLVNFTSELNLSFAPACVFSCEYHWLSQFRGEWDQSGYCH